MGVTCWLCSRAARIRSCGGGRKRRLAWAISPLISSPMLVAATAHSATTTAEGKECQYAEAKGYP